MSTETIADYLGVEDLESHLKAHPRLLGMLFAATVLLAKAAPVLANGAGTVEGR